MIIARICNETYNYDNNEIVSLLLVVLNQVSCNGYEAIWTGENDIMKIKMDLASKLLNKVGGKVGQLYGATKLMRGYKEACLPARTSPPIGHLVFVIHGIGQNMDASDIVKSTSE